MGPPPRRCQALGSRPPSGPGTMLKRPEGLFVQSQTFPLNGDFPENEQTTSGPPGSNRVLGENPLDNSSIRTSVLPKTVNQTPRNGLNVSPSWPATLNNPPVTKLNRAPAVAPVDSHRKFSKKQSTPTLLTVRKSITTRRRFQVTKPTLFKEKPETATGNRCPLEAGTVNKTKDTATNNLPPAPVTVAASPTQLTKPVSYAKILNATLKSEKIQLEHIRSPRIAEHNGAIEIPVDVVKLGSLPFENTLYGYFIGRTLPYRQVCYHCEKMWKTYGLLKITSNGNGYFFFKFGSKQEMDRVLEEGPWIIQNIPLFVSRWEVGLVLTKQKHVVIPLWVKLHQIPCELLTGKGLSHIASALGKPLAMDNFTSEMCNGGTFNLKYARILIEFRADAEWKEKIHIAIPALEGSMKALHEILVEYPWKPPKCSVCNSFGHDTHKCPSIPKPHPSQPSHTMQSPTPALNVAEIRPPNCRPTKTHTSQAPQTPSNKQSHTPLKTTHPAEAQLEWSAPTRTRSKTASKLTNKNTSKSKTQQPKKKKFSLGWAIFPPKGSGASRRRLV